MPAKTGIYIGTSGWSYDHWKGNFYPADLPSAEMLPFYMKYFRTAEINNTFYQLPTEHAVEGWFNTVPEDFVFSVKAVVSLPT